MSETSILERTTGETPEVSNSIGSVFDSKLKELSEDVSLQRNITCIPVVLMGDHVEVEVHAGVKKLISYKDFGDLIGKSINQAQEAPVIKGVLPPSNTIFFAQNASQMFITAYHPGGNKDMLYGSSKMNIVVPNIIISFTLKREGEDWIVQQANFFCTDLPVNKLPKTFINEVRNQAGIYDLPMSNTYGGGGMCYGSNSMPARFKEGNLRGLDWYYRYLWETPFNDDLGVRAIGNAVGVGNWYRALEKHAKADKIFPYVDLAGYRELEGSPKSESAIKRS